MAYTVKILLDSINPMGKRLTTWEITYPRFVHAEFMTHRMFSRNAASSRAIPISKMIEKVKLDPAMPVYWGTNQKGMQAGEELSAELIANAKYDWLIARDAAIKTVQHLTSTYNLHKQIANRLLEPWMFITVIMSTTEIDNFFDLRCLPDAQPEIKKLADMMRVAYNLSKPTLIKDGNWHLPMILPEEFELDIEILKKISVARCARVSYLTHDGVRDYDKDIELCDKLAASGHWSPFEHAACSTFSKDRPSGNFRGWIQYREFVDY